MSPFKLAGMPDLESAKIIALQERQRFDKPAIAVVAKTGAVNPYMPMLVAEDVLDQIKPLCCWTER